MPADIKNDLSKALINAKPFGVRILLEDQSMACVTLREGAGQQGQSGT